MENTTLEEIIISTNGSASSDLDVQQKVNFISNDSRSNGLNWVYLAIKGERLDGHDFIEDAYQNGAIAAIVQQNGYPKSIRVQDSYKALKAIASDYKNRFEIPYIGVTGSSGKTTTKDMIYYAIFESKRTLRNIGNLNSEIGLPMTVLNLDQSIECCVLEMGMYDFGEIDYLAEIVKPNIGVITNVGTAHILNLKSRENILKAKMEISNYMSKHDILIINGDNDLLATLKYNEYKPRIISFGLSDSNDIYAKSTEFKHETTHFTAVVCGEEVTVDLPVIGEHNILNALSALAVCKCLGINLSVSAEGLKKYKPSKYRMEKIELLDKLVINDCYNANPDSMKASIATMNQIEGKRKVAILGDMLELGEQSGEYHFEIGVFAAQHFDLIIGIGEEVKRLLQGARTAGFSKEQLVHFEDNQTAINEINTIVHKGDVILVKGSRGMKLEEVAEQIR